MTFRKLAVILNAAMNHSIDDQVGAAMGDLDIEIDLDLSQIPDIPDIEI